MRKLGITRHSRTLLANAIPRAIAHSEGSSCQRDVHIFSCKKFKRYMWFWMPLHGLWHLRHTGLAPLRNLSKRQADGWADHTRSRCNEVQRQILHSLTHMWLIPVVYDEVGWCNRLLCGQGHGKHEADVSMKLRVVPEVDLTRLCRGDIRQDG